MVPMDLSQPQFTGILLGSGFILSLGGLLYPIASVQSQDHRIFNFLHLGLVKMVPLFRLLWPMGKTPFMAAMLSVLYLSGWPSGFWATLFFCVIACIERSLKLIVKRPRPFSVLSDVQMSQPQKPQDPSHPSGDSMRIWYLAFVIPMAFGLPWAIFILLCSIAILVSLGRIALGVHFPLDIMGGTGLGLIGAGLYQLCL
ncbi:MAG: hypothetical protein B6230_03880 [Desulfobacteraceae bacterium 4572_89]|nr:MAG: hypothetical protein B6230_03880 [Desulfobacteraceae bacterium 4572_89]